MSDRLDAILAEAVPRVCSAAVVLIAVDGAVVAARATGELIRYGDAAFTLAEDRPPARRDSVFDLASISKLFTTSVIGSLVEEGLLDLDEPVATWLPGRDARITMRRLLTHTAGFQPTRRIDLELPDADPATRLAAMLDTPITAPVGGPYLYSDVGLIMAGRVAEVAGGAPLDELVRARVTGVLGMAGTGYRPAAGLLPRIAATEWKPERPGPGCVRGAVHDETSYALGGVAGHAGVFGTADDLLGLGEALRLGGGPMLRPERWPRCCATRGPRARRSGTGSASGWATPASRPADRRLRPLRVHRHHLVVDPVRAGDGHPADQRRAPAARPYDGIRELRNAVAAEALRLARRTQPGAADPACSAVTTQSGPPGHRPSPAGRP